MYYKRCASGKLSILTFLYCYTLVTLSKDITEGSQSANENEHIASVFISRNACMCCIIVNSREKEDYERDIIKNIKHGKQKYDVFLFFFFFSLIQWATTCFPVRIRLGQLLCGSQPISRTCVVWSWRLKECFELVASPVNGL